MKTVVNINKIKFKIYDGLVDRTCSYFNANMIENQDSSDQIENVELGNQR